MFRLIPVLILIVLCSAFTWAGVIHIPDDQLSIQAGIDAAADRDTVLVADSLYYENINFKGKAIVVASYFLIDNDTSHISNTIINGSQPTNPDKGSVVSFTSGEDSASVLCGMTITGGSGTKVTLFSVSCRTGGGVYCYNSACKLIASKIINNTVTGAATLGGGLAAVPLQNSKDIVLIDNVISHNTSTANSFFASGGGLEILCNAHLENNTISHNTCIGYKNCSQAYSGGIDVYTESPNLREILFRKNRICHNSVTNNNINAGMNSAMGGGISIWTVNGTISGNEISNNELWVPADKSAGGAGIMVSSKTNSLLIENNIFRGNAVMRGLGYGGGIQVYDSRATFHNNLFVGNNAAKGGAMVVGKDARVELINNTIINNTAESGAGIWAGNSTSLLMNTIIWGNQAIVDSSIHTESNATIKIAYCDVQGSWTEGTEVINLDPRIEADSLLYDSPCIDSGTEVFEFSKGESLVSPSRDINGRPRPLGEGPDMGAWESMPPTGLYDPTEGTLPYTHELYQNYPNPFNPRTVISYELKVASYTDLSVYNILGQKVVTLVSARQPAGAYQVEWDATGMPSGVYFYRLSTGRVYTETRKLVLMR